ncbi:unnamed protein product [Ambrosiozyma monospora]|uniref:Unnamed protein product n=1 Tax=Ambrosiozyma monospora TaxID=43982 RepID=A0ACB5UCD5_AMBMO|nr:unnamed protein product [Ambrosiozyma monospora]
MVLYYQLNVRFMLICQKYVEGISFVIFIKHGPSPKFGQYIKSVIINNNSNNDSAGSADVGIKVIKTLELEGSRVVKILMVGDQSSGA